MKLIIDSGATKAEWCLAQDGAEVRRCRTEGMNVSVLSSEEVGAIIGKAAKELGDVQVSGIYFYAAGFIEGSEAGAIIYYYLILDCNIVGCHISAYCNIQRSLSYPICTHMV